MQRKDIELENMEAIVLDEADMMLDMGFQRDVEFIMDEIKMHSQEKVQTVLFSATVPSWVKNIARKFLDQKYKFVDLVKSLKNKTAKEVEHLAIPCNAMEKMNSLVKLLAIHADSTSKVIIFTQTKVEANEIVSSETVKKSFAVLGDSKIRAIHGDCSQAQREIVLKEFRENK